jgi:transglutaminase-like putative cysteine protease
MALRWGRWIDHLCLWVALGATWSTGLYEPGELAAMTLPLAAAAVLEALRLDVGRFHRWLEFGALLFFLGDLARGQGVYGVAIHTLFVLAGVRLALPREAAQRRQLLLMGFLLFLTTAIGTTDLLFLVWTLLWIGAATLSLLQLAWEPSAALRRGALSRPPYGRVPLWVGGALLLGAGFFLILPRLSLGFRPGALFGNSRTFGQAGLGDRVDLSTGGPIEPNPEVALRIAPPPGLDPRSQPGWSQGLALLPGIRLEAVQGPRWEPSDLSPRAQLAAPLRGVEARRAEFLFTPSPQGILTLPRGLARLEPPDLLLSPGPGGSLRWRYPRARTAPVTVTWHPTEAGPLEGRLSVQRQELLTRLGPEHEAARRASLRFAPAILPLPQLVQALEAGLGRFAYSLDNPSGRAANPLEDFLERSQAGHCEYFASAMALMLRARGVPARVVNGYRLGPWIPEGGYFRVSQNQAHSWVEYWQGGRWHSSDPTPGGPLSPGQGPKDLGALERWLDALRYRWDRYVVRFSDQDQQTGLSWLQARFQGWEWRWKPPSRPAMGALGAILLAWGLWRTRNRWRPKPGLPGRIRSLRPLLASTRPWAPPAPGETARAWLLRLGDLRPERRTGLERLADAVDAEAYGSGEAGASALAQAEAPLWRGWKPTSP